MNFQKIERTIVITVGSRLALFAIAIANWDKASWAFQQWSRSGAFQADIMAGAIEGALVIFTYMLAQRLQSNANKQYKSDPIQPTRTLWGFVVFLSALSAFCNGLYFTHFGQLANPLGNLTISLIAGIILGLAAPLLAGGIAYLQGEETGTEIAAKKATEKREETNRKSQETKQKNKEKAEISPQPQPVISPEPVKVSDEPTKVSEKTMVQIEQLVLIYGQNEKTPLGDVAESLGVGLSRASEIRAMAVKLHLLDKVSAREFSPSGGEVSVN